jgi:hypothetical protein
VNQVIQKALITAKGRWRDLFEGFFVLAIIRLAALAPLTALATRAKFVALLCPVMIVFAVMPLRFNTALALKRYVTGGKFFTAALLSFDHYQEKLKAALRQTGKILLFGIPMLAMLGFTLYMMQAVDVTVFLRMFMTLGGTFDKGVVQYIGIFLLLIIPVAIGAGLHSADRFLYPSGHRLPKGKAFEHLRAVNGSFLLFLPVVLLLIAAVWVSAPRYITSMFKDISGFRPASVMLLAAGCFYIPVLPLRKLLVPVMLHMNDEN